jgi:hypothetical protein
LDANNPKRRPKSKISSSADAFFEQDEESQDDTTLDLNEQDVFWLQHARLLFLQTPPRCSSVRHKQFGYRGVFLKRFSKWSDDGNGPEVFPRVVIAIITIAKADEGMAFPPR